MIFDYSLDLTDVTGVYVVVATACLMIILLSDLMLSIFKRWGGD